MSGEQSHTEMWRLGDYLADSPALKHPTQISTLTAFKLLSSTGLWEPYKQTFSLLREILYI